ncbi:TIGR04086 family membrane protein [Desulfolucanica intricata]|uniref:TIGR04086 family membrane protein n=1 Tax=Desulfolucanica intricata TaxID=1285191 RepID=UPI00082E1986|nr:TIGR04086 family membrane protein [Desulfolucanica intricata]
MSFNQDSVSSFQLSAVLKSTVIALAISVLLSLIGGFTFYFSDISESILPWMGAGILFLSVAIGGLLAGRRAGTKGLYHGLAVGALFFIITWLVAALILPSQVMLISSLQKLLLSLAAGSLGGILGVGSS